MEVVLFMLEAISTYNNACTLVYLLPVCVLHLRVDHDRKSHRDFVQHYEVNMAMDTVLGT